MSGDGSDGRVAASYPVDPGSNLAISLSIKRLRSKYNPYLMVIIYHRPNKYIE